MNKGMIVSLGALALFGIATAVGCDSASPQVAVQCSSTQSLNGAGTYLVVQNVTYSDPGTAGEPIPLSKGSVRLLTPFPNSVTMCEGDCTAGGTFHNDLTITTTDDGMLLYTVQLGAGFAGSITEVFGSVAPSACAVDFTSI